MVKYESRLTLTAVLGSERPTVVYVGDSATDYECLRHADTGVWLCDCAPTEYKHKSKDVFQPLDLELRPIAQALEDNPSGLCWASSLEDVAKLLGGLQHHYKH